MGVSLPLSMSNLLCKVGKGKFAYLDFGPGPNRCSDTGCGSIALLGLVF